MCDLCFMTLEVEAQHVLQSWCPGKLRRSAKWIIMAAKLHEKLYLRPNSDFIANSASSCMTIFSSICKTCA